MHVMYIHCSITCYIISCLPEEVSYRVGHLWRHHNEGDGRSVFSKGWILNLPAFPACPLGAQCVLLCVSQVKDEQHQCSLGNLRIPLSQLLTSDDMTINQRFQLSNSGPNSTLKMKIALRVLCPHRKHKRGGEGPQGCCPQALPAVRAARDTGTAHGTGHRWEVTAVPAPCQG